MTKERVELDEYGEPNMDYVKMQEMADKTDGGMAPGNGGPSDGKDQGTGRPARKRTNAPKGRTRADKNISDGPTNKKKDKKTS